MRCSGRGRGGHGAGGYSCPSRERVAAKIIIHSVWIVARLYPRGNSWRLGGGKEGLPTEIEARWSERRGEAAIECQVRNPQLNTEVETRSLKMNLATSTESTWGGVGGKENDDGEDGGPEVRPPRSAHRLRSLHFLPSPFALQLSSFFDLSFLLIIGLYGFNLDQVYSSFSG